MKTNFQLVYSAHPNDAMYYTTEELREAFLLENLMVAGEAKIVYTHYDRMMIGGIVPLSESYRLEPVEYQKSEFFLQRMEMGIINVGAPGKVIADGVTYELNNKDALYLGLGTKDILFSSNDPLNPVRFYINACLAHKNFPNKKVSREEAKPNYIGSQKNVNERVLWQYIVPWIAPSCQLMMGITEVKEGNAWNTMPCHRHRLRMEAYFYFEIPAEEAVSHFMGEPQETRHLWVKNEQCVISPEWSIHTAAGTHSYTFIWGMAGSDSDVEPVKTNELK